MAIVMRWIKDSMAQRREARERRRRMWRVSVYDGIYLEMPRRMHSQGEWDTWGKMQARMLSQFYQHWLDAHTYLWLHTYNPLAPQIFSQMLKPGEFEKVPTKDKDEHVFWFPDCQDQHAWETILGILTGVHYGMAVCMLDHKPPDWRKVMTELFFEIVPRLPSASAEFAGELSTCRCLCYSSDQNLAIAKVDLPEATVLSILEGIAHEEDLDLVLHREPLSYPSLFSFATIKEILGG